jgi:hypothetical protein
VLALLFRPRKAGVASPEGAGVAAPEEAESQR